jgi:hypothetical protein
MCGGTAAAQEAPPHAPQTTPHDLLAGWAGIGNVWYLIDVMIVFVAAALAGAALGYHPLVRRKALQIEQFEQPKTFVLYALVGAMSAMVAKEDRNMAFVIFGIGGLMRFRTDVGEAKDTGRVLLATMIGVLVGLKLMAVALMATIFGWGLIFVLERQRVGHVVVQGVDREHFGATSEAYRQALKAFGCAMVGETKNVLKGTMTLVFRPPPSLDQDTLLKHCEQVISKELRGSADWNFG